MFDEDDNPAYQQAAVHRTGAVEFVSAGGYYPHQQTGGVQFAHRSIETLMVEHLTRTLEQWQDLAVSGPCSVALTALGTEGAVVYLTSRSYVDRVSRLRRPALSLPRLDLEQLPDADEQAVATALRPMFDVLAQATGKPASPSFSAEGHWDPQR